MAMSVSSPGSPSTTLYTTIHLSDSEDMGKRRRKRTIIASEQLSKLEALYKQEQWPNRERKEKLAKEIGMSTHFVNIWFQNKRSRMKKMAQEEAELAALRNPNSEAGSETEQQQDSQVLDTITDTDSQGSYGSASACGSQASTASPRPRPHLRPIAPKSPVTPTMASKVKFELPLNQNKLSPQVVCVKLPLLAQSSSPVAKKIPKLLIDTAKTGQSSQSITESESGLQQAHGNSSFLPPTVMAVSETTRPRSSPIPGKCESVMQQQQMLSPAAQQIKVLAQQSLLQQQAKEHQVQQQQKAQQVHQQQVQQQQGHPRLGVGQQQQVQQEPQVEVEVQRVRPAQVRFGSNPSVVLNKLPLTDKASKVQLDSNKQASHLSQDNTPTCSNPVPEASNPPSTYSLFDCLVAMAAVEEGGGIIQKDDPNYDVAVNSTLYGIKIEDEKSEVVLTYDKKKGFRFNSGDVVDDAEF